MANLKLGALFEEDAGYLVSQTVCRSTGCSEDKGSYVLINNRITWKTAPNFDSTWYIFRGGHDKYPHWSNADFKINDRLYGAKHTYLLSIQVSADGLPKSPGYTVNENKRVPTNEQDLEALAEGLAGGRKGAAPETSGILWTGREIQRQYPGGADICISTEVPPPIPAAKPVIDPGAAGALAAPNPAAGTPPDPALAAPGPAAPSPQGSATAVPRPTAPLPQEPTPAPGTSASVPVAGTTSLLHLLLQCRSLPELKRQIPQPQPL